MDTPRTSDAMHDQFLVKMLVENAKRLGLSWSLRPATVLSSSEVSATAPRVILDGDSTQIRPVSLIGALHPQQRVMVMITPPSGLHVVGRIGDYGWKTLTLLNGWVNRPGYQGPKYRLVPYPENHVEIVLNLISGSRGPGMLIGYMPDGYRPINTARIAMSGGTGTAMSVTGSAEIAPDGAITMWDFDYSGAWHQTIAGFYPLDL